MRVQSQHPRRRHRSRSPRLGTTFLTGSRGHPAFYVKSPALSQVSFSEAQPVSVLSYLWLCAHLRLCGTFCTGCRMGALAGAPARCEGAGRD